MDKLIRNAAEAEEIYGADDLESYTQEQRLSALRDYAAWAGDNWRDKLRADWMCGGSDWPESSERWHWLQQCRNVYGPSKLDAIEL